MRRLAVVATFALCALAAACGGTSRPPQRAASNTPTPNAVATVTSQTPTAIPPAARAPELKLAADAPFPPDTEMVVLVGSDHGHGGWFHLLRYVRRGNGDVISTDILTPPETATLTGVVRTASGRLIASECTGMECFYEGGGPKPVTTNFLSSTDDGATWATIGSRPGEWWVQAADGKQALVVQTDNADSVAHFITVPDMAAVTPPPGTGLFIPASFSRLLWSESNEPTLVDSANNVVVHFDLGAGNHAVGGYSAFGNQAAALIREQRGADPALTLLGLFAAGASTPTRLWLAPSGLVLGPWLTDHTVGATAGYGTLADATCGVGPAIIDITAGTIAIIRDPFALPDCIHVARVQFLLWAGRLP